MESEKQYQMPPLSDELIFQMIFCMEDQDNEYCLDLTENTLVQTEFVAQRRSEDPERFVDIPQWYPSDGFRTMEKFVSTLRNPLYRVRLREALQSGKGVFRQFKDILHDSPPLERLWYYYKDKEIQLRIHQWYECHAEAYKLAGLELPAHEETEQLIWEDFTYTWEAASYKAEIEELKEASIKKQNPWVKQKIAEYYRAIDYDSTLVVLTQTGDFAAFASISFQEAKQSPVLVCYGVDGEYQGLGLFKHMVSLIVKHLKSQGHLELLIPFIGEALKVVPMFDFASPISLEKTISINLESWQNV